MLRLAGERSDEAADRHVARRVLVERAIRANAVAERDVEIKKQGLKLRCCDEMIQIFGAGAPVHAG